MTEAMQNNNDISDRELIERYLDGSNESFEILYCRYRNSLYAYLNNLLEQKKSVVDDVFQQTWLKAIRHLPSYNDRNMFLAWLMRIAHNTAMDHCRKDKKEELYNGSSAVKGNSQEEGDNREETDIPDERYTPGKNLEQREISSVVKKAVDSLPQDLREVFLLRMEEIPFREIAQIQKCSINTVLARMQYAVKNLQKILGGVKDDL